MIKVEFTKADFITEIAVSAAKLGAIRKNDYLSLDNKFANGYLQLGDFNTKNNEVLSYILFDFILNDNFEYTRISHQSEKFISIYFLEISENDETIIISGEKTFKHHTPYMAAFLMLSNSTNQTISHKKGTHLKGVNFIITAEWLKENTSKDIYISKIEPLFQGQMVGANLDTYFKNIFDELFTLNPQANYYSIHSKTHISKILFHFLTELISDDLYKKNDNISKSDLIKLNEINKLLIEKCIDEFIGLPCLSKRVFMSESKLKRLYKQIYGLGLYETYLKARMEKAKYFIENNIHSISEIGRLYGYSNLSNFTSAFKKEFGVLPSEIKKIR